MLSRKPAQTGSPSYEGVDWNTLNPHKTAVRLAFSLVWGSGLKFPYCHRNCCKQRVLPRMREWIEIAISFWYVSEKFVLPRMREWIEIFWHKPLLGCFTVLPRMREWIEISCQPVVVVIAQSFSLVWGSGLKSKPRKLVVIKKKFSLVWGSGLKYRRRGNRENFPEFSLVWGSGLKYWYNILSSIIKWCSPSYEGVDWNAECNYFPRNPKQFSLVWGSGLKLDIFNFSAACL